MDFSYLGYTEDRKVVKGTIAALSEEVAGQILVHRGYQVLRLKPVTAFLPSWEEVFPSLFRVKPAEIIMFSRQLAILLESGTDIVTSLELLQGQITNRSLKRALGEVVSDLRSGNRLSVALDKHPKTFPSIYCRSLRVGEQTGSLETVLRQVADYMEKETATAKRVKGALKYPIIVSIAAVVVIGVMVTFVLPAFTSLYGSLGVELPLMTRMLLSAVSQLTHYGPYLIGAALIIAGLVFAHVKTPQGRLQWGRLTLRLPLLGRISHLNELARCCRSMSLLYGAGLPLPEIMTFAIEGSNNKVIAKALTGVQQGMLKGEGLSRPMAKNPLFLPMMVQMVRVGEESGNLDATLLTVAQSYETEAEDKITSAIGLIQPAMTLIIGLIVGLIAMSLVSAMYSIYGQVL